MKQKFTVNAGDAISFGLTILKHGRFVGLLMLLVLTAGLVYYVYARSVYFSRSLVRFQLLNLPIHSESATDNTPYYRLQRQMLQQLRSRHLVERTAKKLGLVSSTGTFDDIRIDHVKRMTVDLLDSNTIKIDVYPYDPALASTWTPALIDEYIDYQSELRSSYRDKAIAIYLDEQDEVRTKLEKSLKERLDFEEDNKLIETFIAQNQLTEVPRELVMVKHRLSRIEDIRTQLTSLRSDSLGKLSVLAAYAKEPDIEVGQILRRQEGSAPLRMGSARKDDTVVYFPGSTDYPSNWEDLEKKRRQLHDQLKDAERKGYLPGHKVTAKLNGELAKINREIERKLEIAGERFTLERRHFEEKLASLEAKLPEYRDITRKYDRFRQDYALLEKGQLAWDKAHAELAEKIGSLEFASDKERVDLEYLGIEQLRDEDPVSPNKMKLVYLSLALGLALGLGVPFGLEYLDDSASKLVDLENSLNLSGLGIIPVCDQSHLEQLVRSPELDARVPDSLLENFRVIRSGIALNNEMSAGAQVIMTSSARPGEGKTILTSNLAWSFASLREKTLLIDGDLRRGRVHHLLRVPNEVGLSNVLNGKSTLEDAIQPTAVPNLFVLTRGPIIPGTTEELCTEKFDGIMTDLREKYQRIMLDTPPVLGLSETCSLMRVVDGMILVVRAERTPKRDVIAAYELLNKAGAEFYGFVLNRLDLSRATNYYNYYYYSASYYDQLPGTEA